MQRVGWQRVPLASSSHCLELREATDVLRLLQQTRRIAHREELQLERADVSCIACLIVVVTGRLERPLLDDSYCCFRL